MWRRLVALVQSLPFALRRGHIDDEARRELEAHADLLTDRYRRLGMTADEARTAARRQLGNPLMVREDIYRMNSIGLVDELTTDARHALRLLTRNRGFTVVAGLTLALGIGATTAIVSVWQGVLLRPLPFDDPDRIVRVFEHVRGPLGGQLRQGLPNDELQQLRAQSRTLSHVDAYGTLVELRLGRDEHVELTGARVSYALLSMLGARPVLGRLFDRAESEAMDPVVVLGYRAWQRHFGGRPDAIGARVVVDSIFNLGPPRATYTVVGIMAEDFAFPNDEAQFWVPLDIERAGGVASIARLRDDVTLDAARREVTAILGRLRGAQHVGSSEADAPTVELVSLKEEMVAPVRPGLYALAAAVGVLLLIALANVANLLAVRNAVRRREMAVRSALGAGRRRLIRQMVTEGVVLAVCGGALGTVLAAAVLTVFKALFAGAVTLSTLRQVGGVSSSALRPPGLDQIALDAPALMVTVLVCLAAGVIFGLAPAIREGSRVSVDALRQAAGTTHGGFRLFRRGATRSVLVVVQIALAIVLLMGGGLLVHSFVRLAATDVGYDPSDALTFQVRLPGGRYRDAASVTRFADTLMAELGLVTGVRAAGYAMSLPMVPLVTGTPMRLAPGEHLPPSLPGAASIYHPSVQVVSPTFPQALGMRVVAGRAFADEAGGPPRRGVLVNEALARGRFPNGSAVGRQVYFGEQPVEVLGVVANVRQQGPDVPAEPQVVVSISDWGLPRMGFTPNLHYVVRGAATNERLVSAVRGAVQRLDNQAFLDNVATLEQLMAGALARPRIYALLFGAFALVASALAAVGIYGVMAHLVSQNTREIGVRMAMGAAAPDVLRLILGRAGLLTALGSAFGIAVAVGVTRYLASLVFGVAPLDPLTLAAAVALLTSVAMIAAWVPARRATRVNPTTALQYE